MFPPSLACLVGLSSASSFPDTLPDFLAEVAAGDMGSRERAGEYGRSRDGLKAYMGTRGGVQKALPP